MSGRVRTASRRALLGGLAVLAAGALAVAKGLALPHPAWWTVVPPLLCAVSGVRLLALARGARSRRGRAAREQSPREREWETTAITGMVSCGLLDLPDLVALGLGWWLLRDRERP